MSEWITAEVFGAMLREEWRLHSRLFGGRRFALFPLLIAALATGTVSLLLRTGLPIETVLAGVHGLALVFGLHTGAIGFVGRDAMRDLLGDLTLLVFAARTLPLARRRLLGLFVVKDIAYYAGLFLLPITVGIAPGMLGAGWGVGSVGLFWLTLTGTFLLGMATTLAGLGLVGRGIPGIAVARAVLLAVAVVWMDAGVVSIHTPYGLFERPGIGRTVGAALPIVGLLWIASVTFDGRHHHAVRVRAPAYRRWLDRLGDPVATRALLDLRRSSGGISKAFFSGAILFGVTVALIELAERITGIAPATGIAFGAILGLTGFTTYNWLTQTDDLAAYRRQPLTVGDVIDGKVRTFLGLGPGVALAFYVPALLWRGNTIAEAAVGAVLLVGVTGYVLGVTVFLAGVAPNEFLFDTALFAAFGVAIVVPLVPILVVAFALVPVGGGLLAGLAAAGVALGGGGVMLVRSAVPRWTRYARAGGPNV